MGRFFSQAASCARARSWTSLELDGELSQFERVFLAAHLRGCAECERFAGEVRTATRLVRETPLRAPERAVVLPAGRRRRPVLALRLVAAATLIAIAAGLGILTGSFSSTPSAPAEGPGDVAFLDDAPSQERELKDLRRIAPAAPPRERANPPGRIGGNA
jgi:predicted anti-sigma-YlaC factor YlaD